MSEPDEAAITRLLAEHGWVQRMTPMGEPFRMWWECACGEETTDHHAHVASLLAAHMADREADAWDECYAAVLKRLIDSHEYGRELGEEWVGTLRQIIFTLRDDQPIPNPFRLTPDTEGETDE